MVMRFIIGQTLDDAQESDLTQESSKHGGFLRLNLQVQPKTVQSLQQYFTLSNHLKGLSLYLC